MLSFLGAADARHTFAADARRTRSDALASIIMQSDDELSFTVDGLESKCEPNDRVRVGMNLPSRQRIVVKRRIGEDAETAVKRYRDDQATAARFAAAINALRASGVNCAK